MNVGRIRGFLLQLPKPSAVRVFTNGESEDLKLNKSFQKTAETIAALDPDMIQCLDSEGKILRAQKTDGVEAHRSDAAEIPVGLAADPQALMLTHFANLLHRAYEHSTETAFAKMIDLVERLGDRSDSIEQRLERTEAANRRLFQDQVDDALDRAQEVAAQAGEGNDTLANQIVGGFLSGQMQGANAGKSNGHGKPSGTPAAKGQG